MATLISREPWWARPPQPGQDEMELEWGYLCHYSDGSFVFEQTRPSDKEIRERKSCRTRPHESASEASH